MCLKTQSADPRSLLTEQSLGSRDYEVLSYEQYFDDPTVEDFLEFLQDLSQQPS